MIGKLGTSVARLSLCVVTAAALAVGAVTAQAAPITGQGTWETTLQPRDLDGDPNTIDAWYDTALDLLWLDARPTYMNWPSAMAWVAGLDVEGTTGWRLPIATDTGTLGCNYSTMGGTDCGYNVDTSGSELAHLWYVTLGNLAYYVPGTGAFPQPGNSLRNTGPFQYLQSDLYWSGTEYSPSSAAWYVDMSNGYQGVGTQWSPLYAMAVRPGDVVAQVPEPGPLVMLFAGLAVLGMVRVRQRT